MSHDDWLERAEVYAVGALEAAEASRFEAHLGGGCAACEDRLRETREALALVPRSLEPVPPPPSVRARLLAEVAREPRPWRPAPAPTGGRGRAWVWWGGWAGAVAAASVLIALGWSLSTTRDQVRALRERVTALQGELSARQAELARREETLRLLGDPEVRYVSLAGLPASPRASGWLLWSPATRTGLFLTRGLPAAPAGRAYELWALAGAEPVPAGIFTVDASGRALFRLPSLPEAKVFDKFAVTLEPAGGVLKPTGPMHLLGSL